MWDIFTELVLRDVIWLEIVLKLVGNVLFLGGNLLETTPTQIKVIGIIE